MASERTDASAAGRETAGSGRLPDFLIIGAAKSGTTSLATWLRSHPEIYIPDRKELHLFDTGWRRGVEWYREQFADASPAQRCGEASPTYLYRPAAPERARNVVPDARLIAVLRHPVDRAWSHYWYERRNRRDSRSFAEAVEAELREGPTPEARGSYLAQGRYVEQLRRWDSHFPRENLHVELFDELRRDPAGVFGAVCAFLNVDSSTSPANVGNVYNTNYRLRSPRLRRAMFRYRLWRRLPFRLGHLIDRLNQAPADYPEIDPGLRRRLLAEFEPHNAELATWLGRELPEAWTR